MQWIISGAVVVEHVLFSSDLAGGYADVHVQAITHCVVDMRFGPHGRTGLRKRWRLLEKEPISKL
jgi:hypothetical protein